jgi:hypothetical protein
MYTTDLMVNNLIEDANDAYRKYRRAGSSNIFDAANATRLARTIDPPDLSVPHTYNNRRQFPDPSPEAMNPALIELAAMLEQFPSPVIRTLLEAGKEYPTDKWMREARTRQRLSQATQDHQKPSVNLSPELALMLKRADDLKARLEASKQRRRSNPDFTRR